MEHRHAWAQGPGQGQSWGLSGVEEIGWCRSQVLWVGAELKATVTGDSRDPGGGAALPGSPQGG